MVKDIKNKAALLEFHKSLVTQSFVCPNYEVILLNNFRIH